MLLITAILDIIVSYDLTTLNYNEAYNLKNDSLSFIWKWSEPWKYKGYLTDSVCFIIFLFISSTDWILKNQLIDINYVLHDCRFHFYVLWLKDQVSLNS